MQIKVHFCFTGCFSILLNQMTWQTHYSKFLYTTTPIILVSLSMCCVRLSDEGTTKEKIWCISNYNDTSYTSQNTVNWAVHLTTCSSWWLMDSLCNRPTIQTSFMTSSCNITYWMGPYSHDLRQFIEIEFWSVLHLSMWLLTLISICFFICVNVK